MVQQPHKSQNSVVAPYLLRLCLPLILPLGVAVISRYCGMKACNVTQRYAIEPVRNQNRTWRSMVIDSIAMGYGSFIEDFQLAHNLENCFPGMISCFIQFVWVVV
jgi:hypothetical protein